MTDLSLTKLQTLLRVLFQFDSADLNFGIYRVLNYKRAEIEAFINTRLPQIADEAFARYASADRAKLETRLQELRQSLTGGFDEAGNLKAPFDQLDMGKEYLEVQRQVAALSVAAELKVRVYNDLYTFFNRYYEDGDFISKRRRGRDETYAVPYNGEEVLLHWANRDQYYIKTDERLAAYRFHTGEFHVAFEVRAAETTANNNKSENRFYVLAPAPVAWDADARLLTVGFQHRALTESEAISFGKAGQQDKINALAAETVLTAVPDTTLKGLLGQVPPGSDKIALLRHLGQFTRRNTLDFFIHKDLKGFLTRELDHFIKTEALRLDDLLADHADALPTQVQRARATRDVALSLIDLLSQVEDFQKRLFEKKKFVLRTDYCLTLDRVPEALWPEVLENEAQKADWQALYALDEIMAGDNLLNTGMGADFFRAHPALMVDTRHFPDDFKWRLLSLMDELDSNTNGVLVNSENFQALHLLAAKYEGKVRCTYLDPPYNTGGDGFLYKDSYQESSWLSFVDDRLSAGRPFATQDGTFTISIDDAEAVRLAELMKERFGSKPLATLIWDRNRKNDARFFSIGHEYMLVFARDPEYLSASGIRLREPVEGVADAKTFYAKLVKNRGDDWEDIRAEWMRWFENIPVSDPRRRMIRFSKVGPRGPYRDDKDISWPGGGGPRYDVNHPTTGRPCKVPVSGWRYPTVERFWEEYKNGKISFGKDETTVPSIISYLFEGDGQVMPSVFYSYAQVASQEFDALFGRRAFDNPKNWRDIARMVRYLGTKDSTTLDYFAGSGTTGHAVINLNREDGGGRRYILVEMGGYFPTVLLPRLKKVVYCSDWKDGKPVGSDGVSQTIKYHVLEQYEDTLNNLDVQQRASQGQQAALHFGDEYLLRYMLDFETQGSPSLLALDALADPFDYTLRVKQGDEIRPHPVDLVETFNYLLGLTVTRLRAFQDDGREYRAVLGEKSGKRVAVVWRKASDLTESDAALARDKAFITGTLLPSLLGAGVTQDRLYVNSPCAVTGAEAVEPEFKRLMFGEAL